MLNPTGSQGEEVVVWLLATYNAMTECLKSRNGTLMLDNIALGILVFVVVILFYGIIAIHDIPYEIAKHRNHPHKDAIHVAGWVSLFTLHVLWPFLWIWATLYRDDRGWGFDGSESGEAHIKQLERQLAEMGERLVALESPTGKASIEPRGETPVDSEQQQEGAE